MARIEVRIPEDDKRQLVGVLLYDVERDVLCIETHSGIEVSIALAVIQRFLTPVDEKGWENTAMKSRRNYPANRKSSKEALIRAAMRRKREPRLNLREVLERGNNFRFVQFGGLEDLKLWHR